MPKLSAITRARKIKLLLFDVDGVLTDGKLYFIPEDAQRPKSAAADKTAQGQIEVKGFHAHDGVANSLARIAGLKTGLITRRSSETVTLRARDLKIEHVRQGVRDKRAALEELVKEERLQPQRPHSSAMTSSIFPPCAQRAWPSRSKTPAPKSSAKPTTPPPTAAVKAGSATPSSSSSKRKANGRRPWKIMSAKTKLLAISSLAFSLKAQGIRSSAKRDRDLADARKSRWRRGL